MNRALLGMLLLGVFASCKEERPTKPTFRTLAIAPNAWKASGKFILHKGHRVFYRDSGHGTAILLLHGFPTSSFDWFKMWPVLARKNRIIAPDFLGFGFSDKPRDYTYSIRDQADLVEELLRELGVAKCRIIAHDYGDTVAQELIARFVERSGKGLQIESVVLLNGGLFPESHRPRFIQKLLAGPLGRFVSAFLDEKTFRKTFSEVFGPRTKPTDDELAAFWTIIRHNDGHRIYHKLIHFIAERRKNRERWVGALQKARIPLRFVNGPEDPISGRHMVQRYRELIPNPDVVVLEGIGHYPLTEAPGAVLKALFFPVAL